MCNYTAAVVNKGLRKGRSEGAAEQRMIAIQNMLELGLSKEQILTKYSEEEYEKAQSNRLVQV